MWDIAVEAARTMLAADWSSGPDYSAVVEYRVDEAGTVHVLDVQLIEPPHATLETRLVPDSEPPRYEPV